MCKPESISSLAPEMRSAETKKDIQKLPWAVSPVELEAHRDEQALSGTGKCFASPLCSFSPASGIHKLYPGGEKLLFAL